MIFFMCIHVWMEQVFFLKARLAFYFYCIYVYLYFNISYFIIVILFCAMNDEWTHVRMYVCSSAKT